MPTKSSKKPLEWTHRPKRWRFCVDDRDRLFDLRTGTKPFHIYSRKINIMAHESETKVEGTLLQAQGWPEIYPAYYFNFLEEELDRVCAAIGLTRDNVVIIDGNSTKWQLKIQRRVVHRIGYKNLPYVHYFGHAYNTYRNFDWGYTIYESPVGDEYIKYAEVAIESGEVDNLKTFFVIPKGKVFGLVRTAIRNFNDKFTDTPLPIIEEDTLNLILENTLNFLKNKRIVKDLGFKAKRGILLTGPPGNGKTMLCKYIQAQCAMKNIEYTSLSSTDVQRLILDKELDAVLKNNTVVFFDDIDVGMLNRKDNAGVVTALLGSMDGMNDSPTSIKIFTTNESAETIDPAFLRPGRIDLFIEIKKPTEELRIKYVDKFWPEDLRKSFDIQEFAKKTEGLSFAEIEFMGALCVNNFIFHEKWDMTKAMEEFKHTRELEKDKRKFGF